MDENDGCGPQSDEEQRSKPSVVAHEQEFAVDMQNFGNVLNLFENPIPSLVFSLWVSWHFVPERLLDSINIDSRVRHRKLAERPVAGQRMLPPHENQASLHVRAQQAVDDSCHNER